MPNTTQTPVAQRSVRRGEHSETLVRVGAGVPNRPRRSLAGTHFRWRQALGRPGSPYSYRWVFPIGPGGMFGSIRIHHWLCSDDPRAAHDHANDFLTLVLWGGYDDVEEVVGNVAWWNNVDKLRIGSIRFRRAEHRHRVEVLPGGAWTLLWMSPPRRQEMFYETTISGRWRGVPWRRWFRERGHHICGPTS